MDTDEGPGAPERKPKPKPRHREFGDALRDALAVLSMTQQQLAERVGSEQPTVSGWVQGADPGFAMVFKIEEALELPPGHLSRTLGYLPPSAVKAVPTFRAVVMNDPLLNEDVKRGLLAMYRALTSRPPKGGRPRRDHP